MSPDPWLWPSVQDVDHDQDHAHRHADLRRAADQDGVVVREPGVPLGGPVMVRVPYVYPEAFALLGPRAHLMDAIRGRLVVRRVEGDNARQLPRPDHRL